MLSPLSRSPPPLSCSVALGFVPFVLASVLPGPWLVCCVVGLGGGGCLTPARVPPPREFPLGGADACTPRQGVALLYGPSICTRFVQIDLRHNQVRRPFPTPGSGTLWVAGESLRDRHVSCLPRWTVCPTRSPSQDRNRSTCRGECSWSGPLATPPGRCHHGPPANGPGRNPPYCVPSGGADTVIGGASKLLRLGPSPASPASSCRPGLPCLLCWSLPPRFVPWVSPFPRPLLLSLVPAVPRRSLLSFPAHALCLLVSGPGSGCLASPPLAARLSLRRCGLSCVPPHVPLLSPRRPRPLPGRVEARGGGALVVCPPVHARCEHDIGTRRGTCLFFPLWGGNSRVAPFVALRTLCTRPWRSLRWGQARCEHSAGTALLYLALSLLLPHPAAFSVGGTHSVPSLSSSPSCGAGGVEGGGRPCCLSSVACTLRPRCKHQARHLAAVWGGVFSFWPPRPLRFLCVPLCGAGGLAVWPSSAPLVPCVPVSGNEHTPSGGGMHCRALCKARPYCTSSSPCCLPTRLLCLLGARHALCMAMGQSAGTLRARMAR